MKINVLDLLSTAVKETVPISLMLAAINIMTPTKEVKSEHKGLSKKLNGDFLICLKMYFS